VVMLMGVSAFGPEGRCEAVCKRGIGLRQLRQEKLENALVCEDATLQIGFLRWHWGRGEVKSPARFGARLEKACRRLL